MRTYGAHADAPPPHTLTGVRFELVRLNERTPDGRMVVDPGFGVRDLPLSFSAMSTTGHGHGTAEIVGSLDEVTIEDDGRVWGLGWLMDNMPARRAGRMIQAGALKGNSIELSPKRVRIFWDDARDTIGIDFTEADLSATTAVGTPAMAGCTVELDEPDFDFGAELSDAQIATFTSEVENFVSTSMTLATGHAMATNFTVMEADQVAEPVVDVPANAPPSEWFGRPVSSQAHSMRVLPPNDQGLHRVFGYVADWTKPHLAVPGSVLYAPKSRTNYAYFAKGEVICADGSIVPTGVLTAGSGHAGAEIDWREAMAHYDDICYGWADVAIDEDEFGIWVAGYVRPGTTQEQVLAGRASGISGDWRRVGGHLELVAALSVNAGAFPTARPEAYSDGQRQLSLTGAGLIAPTTFDQDTVNFVGPEFDDVLAYVRRQEANELATDLSLDAEADTLRASLSGG